MRLFFAFLFCSIFWHSISAQDNNDLIPCASPTYLSDWFLEYTTNPHTFDRDTDTILYVPMTVHIVGQDNGSGYFNYNALLNAFCRLNSDFESTNIQFYIEQPIQYLNSSAYFNHGSVLNGAEMMFANNVENTINTYFVGTAAGSCGYNLPYAGIAMAIQCSGPNSHTWAHEVGHNLSVQHTFLGWEGGVSWDGSIQPNFGSPAPTHVTYNYTFFKDTLILDTLIIDTALVELMDGSNCHLAADRICDTPPDYLAYRWQCGLDSFSTVTQMDPDSVQFKSDGRNIMSYSFDQCVSGFTDGQAALMRANLLEQKPNYLYNQEPFNEAISELPILTYPINNEPVPNTSFEMNWEPASGATHYLIQISPFPSFQVILQELIVESNSVAIDPASLALRSYYWRVRPFNMGYTCTSFSTPETFELVSVINTNNIPEIRNFTLSPNPANTKQVLNIRLHSFGLIDDAEVKLFDMYGRLLVSQAIIPFSGEINFEFHTPALSAGVYLVKIRTHKGTSVKAWVVQ